MHNFYCKNLAIFYFYYLYLYFSFFYFSFYVGPHQCNTVIFNLLKINKIINNNNNTFHYRYYFTRE